MEKQINIPTLRFPEFKGEWEKKLLGNVGVQIIDGDRGTNYPNGSDFSNEGYCLFLNAKNVTKNGFSFIEKSFINKEKDLLLRKGKLERFDIVLTTRGSVGYISYYDLNVPFEHLRINSGMVLIRTNQKIIDSNYLYKYFNSNQIQKDIVTAAFGSAQPQLTVGEISKFKLAFPTLPEQQKIASFFTAIDEKIQALAQKKQLLQQYKKGIMQQLFNQQLRFKDDNDQDYPDWEEKKLGDCLDYLQPTNYLVTSTEYDDSYKTPVLTAGKTFILGYTNEEHGIFTNNLPVIIFDDFTTATQFVDFPFKAKSSAMKILIAKEGVDVKFMYEAMQIMKYEIGGHERHWISKFTQIELQIPSLPEQTKIANFLSSIDEKINHTQTQIQQATQWKKGLLQTMFC